uniref:Uncharacterized protein n=1 Tax=Candidatus Kentrum sp. FM TaxID=2126340 RepID=A0A450SDA9_9GAMM|nr:MAG: hypothetical protein BECKFM1743C_GA0114222_100159 [Candidatus Kentron sp. FM]VFJ50402.1 MAG: hypothetical protein BECKFM1743A_GA0114220_1008310 [Candidatus Kentron sp. FM]VFK08679.1 MAG: hypothetical protein BECKFM1743B_GA0114221_1007811 [Candidatus Kentron sp. FM]
MNIWKNKKLRNAIIVLLTAMVLPLIILALLALAQEIAYSLFNISWARFPIFPEEWTNQFYPIFGAILFTFTIGLGGIFYGLKIYSESTRERISKSFVYYISNSYLSIGFGMGLGVSFLAIFLLFPDTSASTLAMRFGSGYGIYIGVLSAVIGLNIFHIEHSPITDMERFIERIHADLKKISRANEGDFYYVFPAPDIGLFRAIKDNLKERDITFLSDKEDEDSFRNRMKSVMLRMRGETATGYEKNIYYFLEDFGSAFEEVKNIKIRSVIYYPHLIPDFYLTYAYHSFSGREEHLLTSVKLWFLHTSDMINSMKQYAHDKDAGDIYFLSPCRFPQPLIIIGSVVYTIHAFGLPYYDPKGFFLFHGKKRQKHNQKKANDGNYLAEFMVYRRDDYRFAEYLKGQIDSIVSDDGDKSDAVPSWSEALDKIEKSLERNKEIMSSTATPGHGEEVS